MPSRLTCTIIGRAGKKTPTVVFDVPDNRWHDLLFLSTAGRSSELVPITTQEFALTLDQIPRDIDHAIGLARSMIAQACGEAAPDLAQYEANRNGARARANDMRSRNRFPGGAYNHQER